MLPKYYKNISGSTVTRIGTEIANGAFYQIQVDEETLWMNNSTIEADIDANDAEISKDGTDPGIISDHTEAKNYLNALNANCIESVEVDNTNKADGKGLIYRVSSDKLQYEGFFPTYLFYADTFDSPNNVDWIVNSLAPANSDSNNNALTVRLFDDAADEGVGFTLYIPSGTTNIKFSFKTRAETAPGAAKQIALDLYEREIQDNAALTTWSSAFSFALIDIPANENFQYDTETVSLATLGLTAGSTHQFELCRDTDDVGDNLVGDLALLEMIVEFT